MSDETKTTRPNAGQQPTPYQLLQETLQQNQQLIRLLNMKHPGEVNVRWDLMRLGREAADARVAEAIANAEANRLRDRDSFRNRLAFAIGLAAILFMLIGPTVRWWNQHGQPAVAIAVSPLYVVWQVGTAISTNWLCESEFLHPQTRYEVCPRPVYAPLPAPANVLPAPEVQPQTTPEIGAYDMFTTIEDRWLGDMRFFDELEGSYITWKGNYRFVRSFQHFEQSIFVRFPESNLIVDVMPGCSEGQAHDSSLHIDMEYVVMDVHYSPDGTVATLRLIGVCSGSEQ